MSEFWAELVGTALLLLIGKGVVANVVLKNAKGTADTGFWIMITTSWGLAVYVGVVVAAPYSGAHLCTMVTLALWLDGAVSSARDINYVIAPLCGATLGTSLNYLFYKPHYDIIIESDAIRGSFCTSPAIRNTWNNLFGEAIGAFVLIFVMFCIAEVSTIENNQEIPIGLGSVGALPLALLVWVIGLGGTKGYAMNTARNLGPRIVHQLLPIKRKKYSGCDYSWIPICGPVSGGALPYSLKESLLVSV
jgi:glycerol uptake facilitator protein